MSATYGMKEGWEFASKNMGSVKASMMGNDYVGEVDKAIRDLTDSLNSKSGTAQGIGQLKGFVAEDWHAGTFNINAALKGSGNRATVEGSNAHASVDVSLASGETFSMKYYATGKDSAIQQSKNVIQAYHEYLSKSKAQKPMSFEEYLEKYGYSNDMTELLKSVYHGQGRIIPLDQLDEARQHLKNLIATESCKEGPNRAALLKGYEETLSKLSEKIKDGEGIESIPLTKSEAEAIAELCRSGEFNPEDFGLSLSSLVSMEYILPQALKAGFTSAMLTMVMKLGPEIFKAIDYLVKNGEIDVEKLKEVGFETLSESALGFIRGSISASITIACHAGKFGKQFMGIEPSVVGTLTVIVLDTMKNSYQVARGKMTVKEMGVELTKEIMISSAALAGGSIGQALAPELPVLGYMLGSLVGSVVASITINIAESAMLSFCVDSGFSFFGLVEQDYRLPDEVLERLGVHIVSFEHVDIKRVEVKRVAVKRTEVKRTKYNTIDIIALRRGVIGINKIGYV